MVNPDLGIGRAAFTVIWPLQKSGHSHFLRFTEQPKAVLKEVSLCLYRTSRPDLPSPNHVNAEPYGALRIVTEFEMRKEMRYGAQFGHTSQTASPTTFSDQA